MDKDLYELKKILYNLDNKHFDGREIELLDNLIDIATSMKNNYVEIERAMYSSDNIELDRISTETFLYKPILVADYYEGDYLERFGESRTSDLKTCNLLEMHNQFWKAYEVQKGNIFASIPKEFANEEQASKLEYFGWDEVSVEVLEITKCNLTKANLKKYVEKFFQHYVLVHEVYSGANIILKYNLGARG